MTKEFNLFSIFRSGSKPRENCSQLTFTCSKSAIEILEKGVKYVQN